MTVRALDQKLADAAVAAIEERFDSLVPFTEAIPIYALYQIVRMAHSKEWVSESRGSDCEMSVIYRFTPPGWTAEMEAVCGINERPSA